MSSIIEAYREFMLSHRATFYRENVDLRILIEKCNTTTPIQLKLSSDTTGDMAAAIISNVCKYAPNERFPLYGLRAIERIVSKDIAIEETKIQQIFLVHLTKLILDVNTVATYIDLKIDSMTAEIQIDESIEGWISIATATIQHTHIGNIIDDMVAKTFGAHLASRIVETKERGVEVAFISSELKELRGFSGFGVVYINKSHFDDKFHGSHRSGDLAMIDVATVAVHEMAHARARQVLDNLNLSTPTTIAAADKDDAEFGRIVEKRIFGLAIDWVNSIHTVAESFVELFLKSIRDNKDLPVLPVDSIIYPRSHPLTFHGGVGGGADISLVGVMH